MRLTLIAVGRAKRGPEQELFNSYQKRLNPGLDLIEVEEKRPLSGAELKAREAELIAAKIPDGAFLVALDERGKPLSSRKFAEKLGDLRDGGRDIAFIIGGADGLDESLRARADMILGFGPQTWPHMLVRAMLAEQVYRGQSILAGHPYHRD
ncbi:MAG: 23S rRNA (pseudouridine(1915)-N(3))-methyltransferase RlmH [Rhodospirillales bacterium]|nr:23S rRNA (pseudouridine(1915)-N(3))-methyltransferase RlmH [Rhodospirillales bacterium]MBO6785573.1 23S rRNA (pseudouridine(1915)-N(3))-methyltransferase RlmH [Rhodospirillales bacterium]